MKYCYGSREDINKVFYLTIHESRVEPGKSQRRPGVHIDNSGPLKIKNGCFKQNCIEGEGVGSITFSRNSFYNWGGGSLYTNESLSGGIFIASNVPNSCRLWNCNVRLRKILPITQK